MRPYGIVVFPENGNSLLVASRSREVGVAPKARDDEDVETGGTYPIVAFYETEFNRNEEMAELLKLYPGVMFCPITLTTGKKTQPNPIAAEFNISNQGVLPA